MRGQEKGRIDGDRLLFMYCPAAQPLQNMQHRSDVQQLRHIMQ